MQSLRTNPETQALSIQARAFLQFHQKKFLHWWRIILYCSDDNLILV